MNVERLLCVLSLALALSLRVTVAAPANPQESPWKALLQGQSLRALVLAEGAATNDSSAQQTLAQICALVGDVTGALEAWDRGAEAERPQASPPLEDVQTCAALDAIREQARNRQIVILNEAHHLTQTRAFAGLVAKELRKIGFKYFAAEAFSSNLAQSLSKGYPTGASGLYVRDPVFADIVRNAIADGWILVPYEGEHLTSHKDIDDDIRERETQQAENIVHRILDGDPQARIFIYCGFGHVSKTDDPKNRWMAQRLKDISGIDPLCIDQTAMTAHSTPQRDPAPYRAVVAKFALNRPLVLRASDGRGVVFGRYKGHVDLQVVHPPTHEVNGRPDWLFAVGRRRPVPLQPKWLPLRGRTLLQAFKSNELDDAIAVDQLVVTSHCTKVLALPAGRYRMVSQDEAGTSTSLGEIDVGPGR